MTENYGATDDCLQEVDQVDYPVDDYQDDKDYSNEYISYPQNNRYNNAYGDYRGGYDRRDQGPPLGFGPIDPMGHHGFYGSSGPTGQVFFMAGDTTWRRGYVGSPNGMYRASRKDKVIKYLLRCGIQREHLMKLPHDLLMMMQPMNCGLCTQKFETNELSRIHYASKNHLKNQKKWLTQRSSTGSHGREPLKSRDLYCELCDVHITSVGHAESHYAGKPHRSIVEGRKNPRNPFLLQPNKQGRLKALIRRELKFIKKSDSPDANKSKLEPKSGELYCSICKTSMMCSEQMTTHLNGKRHLSKEKQHILRLMKGEDAADAQKNNSKEKAGVDADQGGDMEGDEDDDEDYEENDERDGDEKTADAADDDWGEGGEDWKPSSEDY